MGFIQVTTACARMKERVSGRVPNARDLHVIGKSKWLVCLLFSLIISCRVPRTLMYNILHYYYRYEPLYRRIGSNVFSAFSCALISHFCRFCLPSHS